MLLSNDAGVAEFWHGAGLLLRTSYYIYKACVGGKRGERGEGAQKKISKKKK